jgi:hypothetical protein
MWLRGCPLEHLGFSLGVKVALTRLLSLHALDSSSRLRNRLARFMTKGKLQELCGETRYVAFGLETFALGDWRLCVVADGTVLQGVPARARQSNVEAVARQIDTLPHRRSTREASKPCDQRAARRCEFAGRYSLLKGVRRRSSTHF